MLTCEQPAANWSERRRRSSRHWIPRRSVAARWCMADSDCDCRTEAQVTNAQAGTWSVRVSSLNGFEQASAVTSQANKTITVVGKTAAPADVSNLTANRSHSSVELKWDEVSDLDLIGYEIRSGASRDAGTVVTKMHVGTQIVILLATTAAIRTTSERRRTRPCVSTWHPWRQRLRHWLPQRTSPCSRSDRRLACNGPGLLCQQAVKYELRYGPTSGTWDNSAKLGGNVHDRMDGTADGRDVLGDVSIPGEAIHRLAGGNRLYGTEVDIRPRTASADRSEPSSRRRTSTPARTGEMVQSPDAGGG